MTCVICTDNYTSAYTTQQCDAGRELDHFACFAASDVVLDRCRERNGHQRMYRVLRAALLARR
jgi:hypothetical protein